MPRSSDSIAALAAALAKAQIQLVNPEKSLTATISAGRSGGGSTGGATERSFRYASLSSGLDIVRKILGQHEIAIVQTTAIDQTVRLVNLTTTLAHSSGEWIASDWPVCAVAETASPRRMGAALTYARRYALFTLVGIAGEDDLDAPDLTVPTPSPQTPTPESSKGKGNEHSNGIYRDHWSGAAPYGARKVPKPTEPALAPQASAQLRDRLLAEIATLETNDGAALWAHRRLQEKIRLTAPDAARVEDDFQAKLAIFSPSLEEDSEPSNRTVTLPLRGLDARGSGKRRQARAIDKSGLTLPEPRRIRDRDHVRFVAQQPCLLCGRHPSDAHHLRFAQNRALGRKVSDEFTVPLCRGHHREVHRYGDEISWWKKVGIDPTVPARAMWLETHPLLAPNGKANGVSLRTRPPVPV